MQPLPQITAAQNSAFSADQPNLQLAWDSTSLGTLKECPRKYYYFMLLGIRPRAESVHLTFGLHYHAALEFYDHKRAQGASHAEALLATVRHTLEITWDRRLGRPWQSDDRNKNRVTLLRTVVWYLDQFADDVLQTVILANGKPAVELSFRMELGLQAFTGEHWLLAGHLDRLVTFGEQTYVLDRKTTKSTLSEYFFNQFTPHNQFSLYALASRVIYRTQTYGIICDGAQVAVTFSRFQRGIVTRSEPQLAEWLTDTHMWLELATTFARAGHWPMNDKSCSNYGGCPYQALCSKSPLVRDEWHKSFAPVKWNPLEIRGDI